ncbi:citrate synthase 2 [Faecalicoccus pleomorphus]|uniref:citrate synthase (unknown stereospecificity) n=1 Tax=Faecalicoccus pleomorphus TaxID=1323 RepID=A0A380LN78_9FIRM|nr:citrate synthase [Faecalicoccus pleomorphus]SUO03306.1 citrate synthase 2 [Faecalicoccus pleomorphus]
MINLQALYKEYEDDNHIDSSLYAKYRVKSGLRNENGTGVKVGLTKISDVVGYEYSNGNKVHIDGRLIYRGNDIDDLVAMRKDTPFGFELSAFLLIFGKLPTHRQLLDFHKELIKMADAHNVDIHYQTSNLLNAIQIEVLKLYGEDIDPDSDTLEERMLKGMYILASMPLLMLSHYKKEKITHYPLPDKGIAENVLCIIRQNTHYTQKEASLLDILFMLHADHGGGNNSTFTNVVMSSTGTDIYSCISAALGSLKGPRHGGANIKTSAMFDAIFDEIGTTSDQKVLRKIAKRLLDHDFFDNAGLIYGIGHAIYTKSDPRCQVIKKACKELAQEKGELEKYNCLCAFEKAALYQMRKQKHIETCANVDFYSGFAYSMLGIDKALYTPLFGMARTAGWVAHHLENRQNNRKLIRPANVYVGKRKED